MDKLEHNERRKAILIFLCSFMTVFFMIWVIIILNGISNNGIVIMNFNSIGEMYLEFLLLTILFLAFLVITINELRYYGSDKLWGQKEQRK